MDGEVRPRWLGGLGGRRRRMQRMRSAAGRIDVGASSYAADWDV